MASEVETIVRQEIAPENILFKGKRDDLKDERADAEVGNQKEYKWELVWVNVILLGLLHLGAVYGFAIKSQGLLSTQIFAKIIGSLSTLGVTGGAHRLWCHRSYKANTICQVILTIMMSMTYQNSIYTWCRDHRMHHKYSETDADPHNAKRGFFFCHVGWLLVKKHPEIRAKGHTIDMSDLEANPIVMFQHKYYYPIVFFWTVFFPSFIPWYFFGESLTICIMTVTIYRYILSVNLTWTINSLAHLYGGKAYNKNIGPTENPITKYIGFGEGFHNYHHTFPWDYKAAEMGGDVRNLTTCMIDFFASLGWVTDRKTVEKSIIDRRAEKYGDGSREDWTGGFYNIIQDLPKKTGKNLFNFCAVAFYIYIV